MNNANLHSTAFPTYPVQDNLGQTLMQFGLTKVEYLAAIVCVGVINTNPNILPEVVAADAYGIAAEILKISEENAKKDLTKKSSTIKLG